MSELSNWLKAHGLAGLRDVLEAQQIDLDILPDLTEEDFKHLGHRPWPTPPPPESHSGDLGNACTAVSFEGRTPGGRRRAAATVGAFRRSGRLDVAVGQSGSGGDAPDHPPLSKRGRGRDRAFRRLCSQVHGRRRVGLFRLAEGARGRGRTRGPRRPGRRRGGGRTAHRRWRRARRACRHCHRVGGGRRSRRRGRGAGIGGGRRHAQHRLAPPDTGRTRPSPDRGEHAASGAFDVRRGTSRIAVPQGSGRAGRNLRGRSRTIRRQPLRGAYRQTSAPNDRPRSGAGVVVRALVPGTER